MMGEAPRILNVDTGLGKQLLDPATLPLGEEHQVSTEQEERWTPVPIRLF